MAATGRPCCLCTDIRTAGASIAEERPDDFYIDLHEFFSAGLSGG